MTNHLTLKPGMRLDIDESRCRLAVSDGRLVARPRDGGADIMVTYWIVACAIHCGTAGVDAVRGNG